MLGAGYWMLELEGLWYRVEGGRKKAKGERLKASDAWRKAHGAWRMAEAEKLKRWDVEKVGR
jgi:hypothetical protein